MIKKTWFNSKVNAAFKGIKYNKILNCKHKSIKNIFSLGLLNIFIFFNHKGCLNLYYNKKIKKGSVARIKPYINVYYDHVFKKTTFIYKSKWTVHLGSEFFVTFL